MSDVETKRARLAELRKSMNARHLAVCNAILAGQTYAAAWKSVYTRVKKDATASQNCSENLKKPETGMAEYIEIMEWLASASAEEKLGIDRYYVLAGLKLNVEKCQEVRRLYTRGGKPLQVERPSDENAEGDELVGLFSFDAAGANRALQLLGMELGMFKEKAENTALDDLAAAFHFIQAQNAERSLLPSGE